MTLGILSLIFKFIAAVIHEIVMKSGSSASRLLLCDEETMKKVRIIRSVVGRLIEEKCAFGSHSDVGLPICIMCKKQDLEYLANEFDKGNGVYVKRGK